jgi:hypothetical protein
VCEQAGLQPQVCWQGTGISCWKECGVWEVEFGIENRAERSEVSFFAFPAFGLFFPF